VTLPEVCIRRPVFATVLSIVVLLIGLISYSRLSVREYPRIDEPVVTVETRWLGASAEVVDSQITKILEDSLAASKGVDVMTSFSRSSNRRSPCASSCLAIPIRQRPTCATRSRACAPGLPGCRSTSR
jgi:multidrug efflux pump subunit AcrB